MKIGVPVLLFALLLALGQSAAAGIDVVFDYRYDSSGFFAGPNSFRQNILDSAAAVFETRFQDNLGAISPSGSNSFDIRFFQPNNGNDISISNFDVPADRIVVFVGAYNPGSLAVGGPGGYSASGSEGFLDNAASRGQSGALSPAPTDFAPWGGAISFNDTSNWYFDSDTRTDEPFSGQRDFYSVAVHELAHVLGFGSARSFNSLVSGGVFTGPAVEGLYGSNPPVTGDDHWQEGLGYLGQEAAMDPSIASGQRKHFTELDFAAMKDIGWQVSSIPEAETWAMMLAGLIVLGWRCRVRQYGARMAGA